MYRWSVPGPGWEQMMRKHPLKSAYFWMPVGFSVMALIDAARLTIVTTHAKMLWWPTSFGAVLLIAVAALGAWNALREYWASPTEDTNLKAFAKVRTFFYCGFFAMMGLLLVQTIIR